MRNKCKQRIALITAIAGTIVAGAWQSQGALLTFDDIAALTDNTGGAQAMTNLKNEGFVNSANGPGASSGYTSWYLFGDGLLANSKTYNPLSAVGGYHGYSISGANLIWGDSYGTESFNPAANAAGQADTNWKTAIGTTTTANVTKYGGGTFTFNSAYLNRDATSFLTVQVNGYGPSGLLDSQTVTVPGYGQGPVLFTANWTGLTSLQISGFNASIDNLALDNPVAVPEPTTMIAGALLLLPFGASTLRVLRKGRAA